MRNFITLAPIALAACAATPAYAAAMPFVGPRAELTAGTSDLINFRNSHKVDYGAAAGFDLPLGKHLRFGPEVTVANVFNDNRTFGANVRFGGVIGNRVLVYALGGYENYRLFGHGLDGVRVGGGVEAAITPNLYTKAEYHYSDFSGKRGQHSGLVGVGLRF